jgi:hypothetical protein
MSGDPREVIEQHILTTLENVSISNGYDLPENFALVTREILMWDQTGGKYPAISIQMEDATPEAFELSYNVNTMLPGRMLIYFKPVSGEVPVRTANRYRSSVERSLMQDPSRGGFAYTTRIETTPVAAVWRGDGSLTILEVDGRFSVAYIYDPRAAALL